jgi:hypothetical protein
MLILLLSFSICSAKNLQYIVDSTDHESMIYLDVDSVRMAELYTPHYGIVFRVVTMESFYDRQLFLYTLTQNGSFKQYETLSSGGWSYTVNIYELSVADNTMRLINEEYCNANDDLILSYREPNPSYRPIKDHTIISRIAVAASRYFVDNSDYIKTLPYYDFESDSYKELQ